MIKHALESMNEMLPSGLKYKRADNNEF